MLERYQYYLFFYLFFIYIFYSSLLCQQIPDNDVEIVFEWDPAKVIAERQSVDEWVARNVISMFDQENTLPFIARYRKERTGNMEVEKLREIQNAYSQLK